VQCLLATQLQSMPVSTCSYSFYRQPFHQVCQNLYSHVIILLNLHTLNLKYSEKISVYNNNNNNYYYYYYYYYYYNKSAPFAMLRSVKSQKCSGPIYTAVEALNHQQ